MMAVALVWGWLPEAAVFGLAWSGILCVGEVLQATREDLVLPQAARIDPTDIIELLDIAFSKLDLASKLWAFSAAMLRERFNDLLRAVEILLDSNGRTRTFDLSSLRPGGLSHLLTCCEGFEIVRRRG